MNIKLFNICLLVGWLMILAGGVVIHPGWGIAIAGAVLFLATIVMAYVFGVRVEQAAAAAGRADGQG